MSLYGNREPAEAPAAETMTHTLAFGSVFASAVGCVCGCGCVRFGFCSVIVGCCGGC